MKQKTVWVWEFSKKVVILCTVIYAAIQLYAMVVMAVSQNFEALTPLIDDTKEIMQTCVFGYMIKSGIENALKIKKSGGNEE